MRPASTKLRLVTLATVLLPFAGLVVAMILLWHVAFSWVYLMLLGVMYVITAFGVTVGFHRLFTHKSFQTSKPVELVLGVLGSMSIQGPLLTWVAVHRRHHHHSDDDGDPHSPHLHGDTIIATLRGFFHSHVGWMFTKHPDNLDHYVQDLRKDGLMRAVSALFPLWAVLGLLVPAALGGLLTWSWTGILLGLIWGGLVRVFIGHHLTWSVNSVCHIWGGRPFRSNDESRNNLLLGILAFGEGWHNNHHAFPTSARHGLRWWQIDLSYIVIRGMELLGLARAVRVPSVDRIEAKRADA
ncbi:MAG: fatty acid desaturase [Phycisphaerales bacterium]|nr:fatty acid desaturase [Phycisphaerales bacterium]MCI0674828.1 fatty acid desaturase [Phycisphaerales bacterium]